MDELPKLVSGEPESESETCSETGCCCPPMVGQEPEGLGVGLRSHLGWEPDPVPRTLI
jgi:hypothetical protein